MICYEICLDGDLQKAGYFLGEESTIKFVGMLFDIEKECFTISKKSLKRNKKIKNIAVLAHNGNNFDHVFLFPILLRFFGERVNFGGSSFSLKFLSIDPAITFIDTCELIPGKLASLAEDFQV